MSNYRIKLSFQESGQCDYGDLVDEKFYFTLEEQIARQVSNVHLVVTHEKYLTVLVNSQDINQLTGR